MIAAFKKSSRASLAFAGVVALLGFASLTDAQTAKWVTKTELAPEAKVTFDRLSAPIDVEFTEARVLDIVQSIAAKAGVAVTVAPEVSSALTEAPAVSLKTEKLPGNVALIHTLGSVGLGLKFAAGGIEITKADEAMDHVRVIHAGEPHMGETERVLVFKGKGDLPEDIEGDLEAVPGDGKKKVIVKHLSPAGEGEQVEKRVVMIHPDGTDTEAGEIEMLHIDGAKLEIKVHKKN